MKSTHISFAKISTFKTSTEYIIIWNGNHKNIHIILDTKESIEYSSDKSRSQIIPGKSYGKIPVNVFLQEYGKFKEIMDIYINSQHSIPIQVESESIPVTLELNLNKVKFEYSNDNWNNYIDKVN